MLEDSIPALGESPMPPSALLTQPHCPIVGIGASAGGLEALENFFRTLPPDLGFCYIVVTHLDPNHKSLLTQLLRRYTAMPVEQIVDGTPITPNSIFVIPPNRTLRIHEGLLRLSEPAMPRGFRDPINCFFISLAEEFGNWSVGIILSGTGSDGTAGCQEIRNRGGYVLVQEPASAQYDGMPTSVTSAGLENFVGSPAQLAQELVARRHYIDKFFVIKSTDKLESEQQQKESEFLRLLHVIKEKSGHDLSHYKRPTLLRRLERRMSSTKVSSLRDYIELLQEEKGEADEFLREVLINVTSFNRDPKCFEALRSEVIRELVRVNARTQSGIRIWVAGCSSGEEPYSIAMAMLEEMDRQRAKMRFTIFATDIDPVALDAARSGFYADAMLATLSAEQKERFFVKEEGGYRVSRLLRNSVVFAHHNLTADAPLSRIDLVVCRNVFIYFEPCLQQKCLQFFHYALNHGGYLYLGASEAVPENSPLFRAKNMKARIYVKEVGFGRNREVTEGHFTLPAARTMRRTVSQGDLVKNVAQNFVLQTYAPAVVIVNENYEVLHTIGPVDKILQLPSGAMENNILNMCPSGNRLEIQALIRSTFSGKKEVGFHEGLKIVDKEEKVQYEAHTHLLPPLDATTRLLALAFVRLENPIPVAASANPGELPATDLDPKAQAGLEQELKNTRDFLQSVVDELERSNLEHRAANEELTSMNEELQSTTEELETSKEELQSINEELQSVNAELQEKVSQLGDANDDMSNLLNGTEIATLFLDANLCIKKYTSAIVPIFRLLPADVGRPISHITHTMINVDLTECFGSVLKSMNVLERELCTRTGQWYIMRAIPYRTMENTISGVVVTFTDITELKNFQDALSRSEGRNTALLDSIPDTLVVVRKDGSILDFKSGKGSFQILPPRPYGRNLFGLLKDSELMIGDSALSEIQSGVQKVVEQGGDLHVELQLENPFGPRLWFDVHLVPCGEDSVLCIFRNVSERKELESRLNRALQSAEKASRAKSDFVANVSHELRTPLNAIIGFAELLQAKHHLISDDDRGKYVAHIREGGRVLLNLVNAILDLAKIESGNLELRYTSFVAQDVIRNTLNLARPIYDRKKIVMEINLPAPPIEVFADEARFVQVILNLVSNAGKFTPEGGTVRISADTIEEERFQVSVADNGPGVAEADRAKIFERFGQGSMSGKGVGTGLGLTLAKNFVELHGGKIGLTCPGIDNKGCKFSFWIPLRLSAKK